MKMIAHHFLGCLSLLPFWAIPVLPGVVGSSDNVKQIAVIGMYLLVVFILPPLDGAIDWLRAYGLFIKLPLSFEPDLPLGGYSSSAQKHRPLTVRQERALPDRRLLTTCGGLPTTPTLP